MKRVMILVCSLLLTFSPAGCGINGNVRQPEVPSSKEEPGKREPEIEIGSEKKEIRSEESETMQMKVQVGDSLFSATLEENEAARDFAELMKSAPVVVRMSDYSGFEKVGDLGTGLPADDSRITTQSGDIVLYNGNQIVVFYGSNSYSYTRLGRIDDLAGWAEALGAGDVTVSFSVN